MAVQLITMTSEVWIMFLEDIVCSIVTCNHLRRQNYTDGSKVNNHGLRGLKTILNDTFGSLVTCH